MHDGLLTTARAALGRGDVLMAYDAAVLAMEAEPESLEAAFVAALALARAGASERARETATELLARMDDDTTDDPIQLHEDAAALETLTRIDLEAIGLPRDLERRIGAHAGPVMKITDPVSHKQTYWGRELTRAARIEPRTPEGEVYVTDAFAALLSLVPVVPFVTEYVGRVTTAKEFETIPMYLLRHR